MEVLGLCWSSTLYGGGQLNRPYAMALEAAWEERYEEKPEIFPGNDAIVIQLPQKIEPDEILSLVTSANVEPLLKKQLESTGFFSARFRECAGRALLVIKNKINQRMPLWMTRLKSKKLLENILIYEDFPILLETWRTCLKDEFNLTQLQRMLDEVASGVISWSAAFTSHPSPFAAGMAWNQINQYMYQEDQGASSASALGTDLLRDVVFSPNLRPSVSRDLVHEFEQKCQRLVPGYTPQTHRDLVDWVKERIALPYSEWNALISGMQSDIPQEMKYITDEVKKKLVCLHDACCDEPLVVSLELMSNIIDTWYGSGTCVSVKNLEGKKIGANPVDANPVGTNRETDLDEKTDALLLGQWLQFYGPVSGEFIQKKLGIEKQTLNLFLDSLIEERQIISGTLVVKGSDQDICDSDNFEILLRLSRSRAMPEFEALDIQDLPLFLAQHQGVTKKADTIDALFECLEQLVCLPLSADAWESDVLPSRIHPYRFSFLDTIMQEGDLRWMGMEKKKVAFCFKSEIDFLKSEDNPSMEKLPDNEELESIFESTQARYDFGRLLDMTSCSSNALSEQLWSMVWQGKLSNETFSALRKGIETRFKPQEPSKQTYRSRFGRRQIHGRKSFSQWKGSLPFSGFWFNPGLLSHTHSDFIEAEELNKDRVRLLMDRYGILFRELLLKELPQFRWPQIFRSLRLMELTGEILAGHFFKEISSLQFMSPKAFRRLKANLPKDKIYFLNATDPASACGLPIPKLKQMLPKRLSNTHLVFKGRELKLVSLRNGKELIIHAQPEDESLTEYLSSLNHLLNREFKPQSKIAIEKINGDSASKSPYLDAFKTIFSVLVEHKKIILYKNMELSL